MAIIIIQPSDFAPGTYYELPQSPELNNKLQALITKYEKKYIYQILGQALGDIMIADCTANAGVPVQPTNLAIFNAIAINDPDQDYALMESEGLKNILLNLIKFHYIESSPIDIGQAGLVNTSVDAAHKVGYESTFAYAENYWNEAVVWIICIQWYCVMYDRADYPLFHGQLFRAESSQFLG